MRSAITATALGITLTIAGLAACTGPRPPGLSPGPGPSGTPVFASEEEALAAAEELYGEYLAAENLLGQGGWTDVSLVEPYVRGDALDDEFEAAEELSSKGYRQVGDITFDSLALQQLGESIATYYLCLDVSAADTVDVTGASIVGPERPERVGFEVDLDDVDGALKIARSEPWSGENFC